MIVSVEREEGIFGSETGGKWFYTCRWLSELVNGRSCALLNCSYNRCLGIVVFVCL